MIWDLQTATASPAILLSPCHHLASDREVQAANSLQSSLYPQVGINRFHFQEFNLKFSRIDLSYHYNQLKMHRRQLEKHTFKAVPKLRVQYTT